MFTACERSFIDLLDFEKFKVPNMVDTVALDNFQFELLKNLPSQIERFFELQRFDMDSSENLIESPRGTVMSLSDTLSNPDLGLKTQLSVGKRDSLLILEEEGDISQP